MAQRRTGFFIATALAACLAASGGSAQAQFGGQAGFADAFRIDFLERDLPLFVETLKLEEWQRPIVESLLQDYQLSFTAGVEEVREKMRASTEQIAASREDDVMKIILQPLDAWDEKRIGYRDNFLQNVKAQLSSDQLSQWPHFERTLRRDKSLSKGELMGESIDLFIVVRNMRMPFEVEQSVDPMLMDYELELDAALKSRQQVMDSLQDKVKDAMASMDFDAGLSAMDQIMTTRIRIREVQDGYINQLAEALPSEWGETFRQTAFGKAYPKVFRPNPIDKMIESARLSPDMTDAQLAELDSVEVNFRAQLSALEQRLLQAYRIHEPNTPRLKVQRMLDRRDGRRNNNNDPTEMDRISAERNDLISETRRLILAILTPEQIGAMPGSSERPRNSQNQNGRRSRLPMGGPDPSGVGTPTFRGKQPPSFGSQGEDMGDGPSKVDPSNRGGSKPRPKN
jgi:hypothetical protein